LTGAQIDSRARAIFVFEGSTLNGVSAQAPNVAGVTRVSVSFVATATTTAIRFYHGHTGGTIWWDDLMMTEGTTLWPYHDGRSSDTVWTGTADASTSRRGPSSGLYTYAVDPHGQTITLNADAGLMQVIPRADVEAATWSLSWTGTATGRVYNVGTDPASLPVFAASGSTWVMDGLDDVAIEFRAVGSTKTLGAVQFEKGATVTPFELVPVAYELALCRMDYRRMSVTGVNAMSVLFGFQPTLTVSHFVLPFPMRTLPGIAWSNMQFSDNNGYATAIVALRAQPESSPEAAFLTGTMASNGAIRAGMVIRASASGAGWLEFACPR
jgi:hypothetical protein